MIAALLLIISVSSTVTNNAIMNFVSKRLLKLPGDVSKFNSIAYVVCTVIFCVMAAIANQFSWFSLWLGALFGVVTALNAYCCMLALKKGPMHITLLITTSSMLIPTFYDVVFGVSSFSIGKLLCALVLIVFIYISVDDTQHRSEQSNRGWLLNCFLAFLLGGLVGIMQKFHQTSNHSSETYLFLTAAFVSSMIFTYFSSTGQKCECVFDKKLVTMALLSGICIFTMNLLNLHLAGIIPSQLFFPMVNGSSTILSSILAVVVFHETISVKKVVGLIGGILTLTMICFLP